MNQVKKLLVNRDVIDDVVISNSSRDLEKFNQISSLPAYKFDTNTERVKLKFDTVSKSLSNKRSLISPIKDNFELLQLNGDEGHVYMVTNQKVLEDIKVSPVIIRLVKACAASSYSTNEEYTEVVSTFIKELLRSPDNISIPLQLPMDTKMQKLVSEELNEFLKELLIQHNIKFHCVVEIPGNSKRKDLLDAIDKMGRK